MIRRRKCENICPNLCKSARFQRAYVMNGIQIQDPENGSGGWNVLIGGRTNITVTPGIN